MYSLKNKKIFLLDASDLSLELHHQYLYVNGYELVTKFNDSQSLIDSLSQNPSVIFIDDSIPEVLEIVSQIKKSNPHIYLVVMIGQQSIKFGELAVEKGAFSYLVKDDNSISKFKTTLKAIENMLEILDNNSNPSSSSILKSIGKYFNL